jgi:hypothetical protein
VASANTTNSDCLAGCQTCNSNGMSSTQCSAGLQKCLLGGAFQPGAGEPAEAAFEANGCIINACQACLDWYSAQAVCKLPQS